MAAHIYNPSTHRLRQEDLQLKGTLGYIVSSRSACAECNPARLLPKPGAGGGKGGDEEEREKEEELAEM